MNLLLIAGFLGSGKTTLAMALTRAVMRTGRRISLIVNDISEIGVDNQLMRLLSFDVHDLSAGCICCTLSSDLVSTLKNLDVRYDPDLVIVEPTGIADPCRILATLSTYTGRPLGGVRAVTVVDPLRLPDLYQALGNLITVQIQGAEIVVMTKIDIASLQQIDDAHRLIQEIAPGAETWHVCASAPDTDLVSRLTTWTS